MRTVTLDGEQALGLVCRIIAERADDLQEHELEAFNDMARRRKALSEKQRVWVVDVAQRIGVDPNRNVFSKMTPVEQEKERSKVVTLLPWERGEMTRPLKPPGRT